MYGAEFDTLLGEAISIVVKGDQAKLTGLLFSLQNPAAAVVKTLTLVLGEYELGGFLETDFPDEYSRAFSVALLVILAIIGSLVMVNLFVAIIVSDIEDLRAKGLMQESVIKAQHIVSKISTQIEFSADQLEATKYRICS